MAFQCDLPDDAATVAFGRRLASCSDGGLIFLSGELGAGKTTLTRGILRELGHDGAVKSPTFTVVEPYDLDGRQIFHFDLYRLSDPDELEYLGVDDYLTDGYLCLVEWPERGADWLPRADLVIHLSVAGEGRHLEIVAGTERGERVVRRLANEPVE